MNTTTRIIAFGAVSGLIWSVIAASLSGLNVGVTIIISGVTTGVAVSLALKFPLQTYGRWSGFVFGALSLPFGAFIFGVIISLVNLIAGRMTGSGDFPFTDPSSNAIGTGVMYAVLSVVSLFSIALLPLAVLTTFLLRGIIQKHEATAS